MKSEKFEGKPTGPFKVLFVDDESSVLEGLRRTLRDQRKVWDMDFSGNVDEALEMLHSTVYDVVISDISMPGKDGFQLLSIIRHMNHTQGIPVLMLTGLNERTLKRRALELGATDLLNKPADKEDLVARINSMLRIKSYQDELHAQNELLEQKVRERTADLEAARLDLIWRLGKAAEYRDTDTGNHVVRVGYYCKVLAEGLGADSRFIEMIFLTSPLHDIGKIGIPDEILLKEDKLTQDEWKVMRKHCQIGADILGQDVVGWKHFGSWSDQFALPVLARSENPFLKMAGTIALTHHERWDGRGYPGGLMGTEIPLEARIVTVADVYDALFSSRPYKPLYGAEKVFKIMGENVGSVFDPEVFASFEKSMDLLSEIHAHFSDEVCYP